MGSGYRNKHFIISMQHSNVKKWEVVSVSGYLDSSVLQSGKESD